MSDSPWRMFSQIAKQHVGTMCMFFYDAKTKEKLPYWDKLPVIFIVDVTKDGFYGINMHYLPPFFRAKLMDALYDIVNNKNYDQTTKLQLSYKILSGSSQFSAYKPCFKRYLNSYVRSRFMYISPQEWNLCLFLPLERFQKASTQTVWNDSTNIIDGQKIGTRPGGAGRRTAARKTITNKMKRSKK